MAISARLRRTPARWLVYFSAAMALVVSAAFGGWQAVSYSEAEIKPGVLDAGPAGWAAACLFIWIVAFPMYLAARPSYVRQQDR